MLKEIESLLRGVLESLDGEACLGIVSSIGVDLGGRSVFVDVLDPRPFRCRRVFAPYHSVSLRYGNGFIAVGGAALRACG